MSVYILTIIIIASASIEGKITDGVFKEHVTAQGLREIGVFIITYSVREPEWPNIEEAINNISYMIRQEHISSESWARQLRSFKERCYEAKPH